MKKMRLLGFAAVLVVTGTILCECAGLNMVSHGKSGIGYVNHELGIVFWHVDDVIRGVRGVVFDL